VLRRSDSDRIALIGAGITLYKCLDAADELAKDGINVRVIDLYSVKPVDVDTLRRAARDTGGRLLVAEDHYPHGGIGAAVMEALAQDPQPPRVVHLAVRGLPTSGTSEELLTAAGINTADILAAARSLVR
jgi:transketolase